MEKPGGREYVWIGDGSLPENIESKIKNPKYKNRDEEDKKLDQELRNKLESLNFDILQSIFSKIGSDYGVDESRLNFINRNEIYHGGFPGIASYKAVDNVIEVGIVPVEEFLKQSPDIREDLAYLYFISHEETHAIGHVECRFSNERMKNPLSKAGFDESVEAPQTAIDKVYDRPGSETLFHEFNEGITDLIALEVIREYSEQSRDVSEEQLKKLLEGLKKLPYERNRSLAKGFIYRFAKTAEIDETIAWDAIKAAYVRGDTLIQGDLREYFDSVLGEEYMKNLAKGFIPAVEKPERTKMEQLGRDVKAMLLKLKRKI